MGDIKQTKRVVLVILPARLCCTSDNAIAPCHRRVLHEFVFVKFIRLRKISDFICNLVCVCIYT